MRVFPRWKSLLAATESPLAILSRNVRAAIQSVSGESNCRRGMTALAGPHMEKAETLRGPFARLAGDLDGLRENSRLRSLAPQTGIDFSSNDYLGLAGSARLKAAAESAIARGVPVGSGGSRLLRGNHPEHEKLEAEAVAFLGCESTLFMASGYAANSALLSTLPQRGDIIFFDELIHASAHEGMRFARAETRAIAHNDVDAFADALAAWRADHAQGTPWIAVETLYSMDGDRAPLEQLLALADRYDAVLYADDAHATGVWGDGGRGLASILDGRENTIVLRTCGKALGCEGALLSGPRIMRDHLVNRARNFIFSTAPSPLMAACVREALSAVADEPHRREELARLVDYAGKRLAPFGVALTGSQIMPLVLGGEARTMTAAEALQARGFDIRGIRPPTVPHGSSRLRISLTLNVGREEIDALASALEEIIS